jgi:hypothetical protein
VTALSTPEPRAVEAYRLLEQAESSLLNGAGVGKAVRDHSFPPAAAGPVHAVRIETAGFLPAKGD